MSEVLIPTPELTLGPVLIDALVDGLTPLTAMGFMYEEAPAIALCELERDVHNHVVPVERLRIVSDEDGNPVAFLASEVKKTPYGRVLHAGGCIVHPDFQGKGMGRKLLVKEIEQTNAKILAFHTQNIDALRLGMRVAEMDVALAFDLAPVIGTPNPHLEEINGGYYVVHSGRYGQSLYYNIERFREEEKVIPDLNFLMGDAVVFVGEVRPEYRRGDE